MQNLSNGKILDLISYSEGIIFVEIIKSPTGENKLAYRSFNMKTGQFIPITMGVYLINKFGPSFEAISKKLTNFVLCDAFILSDRRCFVLSPEGEAIIFSTEGNIIYHNEFLYHDNFLRSGVNADKYIWCTVPKENSLVQYDAATLKVHLRIGSAEADTFSVPYAVSYIDDKLYVTNAGNGVINEIDPNTYAVATHKQFNEPVYKYFKIADKECVWLKSGIYYID